MPVVRIWRREVPAPEPEWELEVRPRRSVWTARIIAVVVFGAFLTAALILRIGDSGVNFRLADQIALVGVGLIGAGVILLLTRPRLRAGRAGVSVRNILDDRLVPWDVIRGVSFADRRAWARLELMDDDYVPILALRANDKLHAVRGVEKLRELGAKYALGDQADSGPAGA